MDNKHMISHDDKKAWEFGFDKTSYEIVSDTFDEGVRIVIVVARGTYFCLYLGIPKDHPLADFTYDLLPIDCHWGLTFGDFGDDNPLPKDFYWYGWDYAHVGDSVVDLEMEAVLGHESVIREGKEWTIKLIKQDAWSGIYDFKKLVKLAEGIQSRSKGGSL